MLAARRLVPPQSRTKRAVHQRGVLPELGRVLQLVPLSPPWGGTVRTPLGWGHVFFNSYTSPLRGLIVSRCLEPSVCLSSIATLIRAWRRYARRRRSLWRRALPVPPSCWRSTPIINCWSFTQKGYNTATLGWKRLEVWWWWSGRGTSTEGLCRSTATGLVVSGGVVQCGSGGGGADAGVQ